MLIKERKQTQSKFYLWIFNKVSMAAFVTVVEFSDKRRSKQVLSSSTSIFKIKKNRKIYQLFKSCFYLHLKLFIRNKHDLDDIQTVHLSLFFFYFLIFGTVWIVSRSLFILLYSRRACNVRTKQNLQAFNQPF